MKPAGEWGSRKREGATLVADESGGDGKSATGIRAAVN